MSSSQITAASAGRWRSAQWLLPLPGNPDSTVTSHRVSSYASRPRYEFGVRKYVNREWSDGNARGPSQQIVQAVRFLADE